MKANENFCKALIESMGHVADACQDAAINAARIDGNPAAPYILLDKIMEAEDRVREMARRGFIPEKVAAEAIKTFEDYIEERDLLNWSVDFFDDPPEIDD